MSGTSIACVPLPCYAMRGTDVAYDSPQATTVSQVQTPLPSPPPIILSSYHPTRCPVLTSRTCYAVAMRCPVRPTRYLGTDYGYLLRTAYAMAGTDCD
eukprot:1261371-Rhodomonas_salina.2